MGEELWCVDHHFSLLLCHTVGDAWRVTLRGDLQTYIHAVFVNVCTPFGDTFISSTAFFFSYLQGYKQQRAFIMAQSPMESIARDFWKMVHDRKCGVIVMLCDLVENGQVASPTLAQ